MNNIAYYPVFEASQVLSNDHLNSLLNYSDLQSRLTRIKLLGSGIVCGLDLSRKKDSLLISKGIGLTSQGFIITACDTEYKYYRPFDFVAYPQDLQLIKQCSNSNETEADGSGSIFYSAKNKNAVWRLLSQSDYDELAQDEKSGCIQIANAESKFFDENIVVLFLQAEEEKLKNCDTNSCDDKGSRMNFKIKALLADKSVVPANSIKNKKLPNHVELKRYNVPDRSLRSTEEVLNAFCSPLDNTTLSNLEENLKYCWDTYKESLMLEGTNPFAGLNLQRTCRSILEKNPVMIQYFYDFINDLIKALYEFRYKSSDDFAGGSTDEMDFPFHLMLGEASADTKTDVNSDFRQYFKYSPLLDFQNDKLKEMRSLLIRMKIMVNEFVLNESNTSDKEEPAKDTNKDIKITPSQDGHYFLSEMAIPYYYKVKTPENELYRFWNYEKTRRGNEIFNLGYNSRLYNSAENVVNPLLYDISWYNFFRIEGHIGMPVGEALALIQENKQKHNLPFNITALSADCFGAILNGEEPKCAVQDLETDYKLLVDEFTCKVNNSLSICSPIPCTLIQGAAALANLPDTTAVNSEAAAGGGRANPKTDVEVATKGKLQTAEVLNLSSDTLINMISQKYKYTKGDTLSGLCKLTDPNNIGALFINSVDKITGKVIYPALTVSSEAEQAFKYIDAVESILAMVKTNSLSEVNVTDLTERYGDFIKAVNNIIKSDYDHLKEHKNEFEMLSNLCFAEEVKSLKAEYERRTDQYRQANNFYNYYKQHGGIEHKAGVPKGGTFIMVYHEEIKEDTDGSSRPLYQEISGYTPLLNGILKDLKSSAILTDEQFSRVNKELYELKMPQEFLKATLIEGLTKSDIIEKTIVKDYIAGVFTKVPAVQNIDLKEGTVIADFCVPYLSSSDCPPVAYIFTEKQVEKAAFSIETGKFLFDDARNYPFTTVPPLTDANKEQKPFSSPELNNPDALNLWTDEKNTLYIHPAMELPKTLNTTISYKGISLPITIIKPDAAFKIQVTEQRGKYSWQFEADNKDAAEYIWTVHGKQVDDKKSKTDRIEIAISNRRSIIIGLTISYNINGNISQDSKKRTVSKDEIVSNINKDPF